MRDMSKNGRRPEQLRANSRRGGGSRCQASLPPPKRPIASPPQLIQNPLTKYGAMEAPNVLDERALARGQTAPEITACDRPVNGGLVALFR